MSLLLISSTSLNTNNNPIVINIIGNNSFNNKPNSIKSLSAKKSQIPITKKITLVVLSLFSDIPINEGIIINKVHHPLKNIFTSVRPKAFKLNTIPIKISTKPKIYFK